MIFKQFRRFPKIFLNFKKVVKTYEKIFLTVSEIFRKFPSITDEFWHGIKCRLRGYSNGHSHFSEINAKFAEKKEFVSHSVQKCLETSENEQNVVLN